MPKVADVKLTWIRSPSSDAKSARVVVKAGDAESHFDLRPDVQQLMVIVKPSTTVTYSVVTFDDDGLAASSEGHTFVVGDLELPLPATGLDHQIISIREEP